MKIMLDCSPKKIKEYSEKYNHDFWQLRTPLTNYALSGKPYGLDNGCYSRFPEKDWMRLISQAKEHPPVFACSPDIVGDAIRTLDLFAQFESKMIGLPRALVLQDGIGNHSIPWDKLTAVFLGGSDRFKISTEAVNACKTAKMLGKWVHIGRVNTPERVNNWLGFADSLDGSGVSKIDERLEDVLAAINATTQQIKLI